MFNLILGGGLGNQMFQYAYARALQLEYGIDFGFNFQHYNQTEPYRSFALSNLNILSEIPDISDDEQKSVYNKTKAKQKRMSKLFFWCNQYSEAYFHFLNRRGLYYTPNTYKYLQCKEPHSRDGVIIGAFQSWKYFDTYKETVSKELLVKTPPSSENLRMMAEISESNSVCVHVRRGDYINTNWSKNLDICSNDYYGKAMNYIAQHVDDPRFYLFTNSSEDIEWIKKNYNFDFGVQYVDLSNPDYEELRLMYSCKHFIISNSTFSWWAQYLSRNKNKIVIAPSLWTRRTDIDFSDIYMPNWVLMPV